jgi:bifunctional non-homologous end joining protein LigD
MKAKLVDSVPSGDWIYEIKFDGYRALALRGGSETRILSRNQKDLGSKFSEVKDSIGALDIQEAIIDREIVALDKKARSSFQLLQGLDMGQKKPSIAFYAFDLLQLNGKDLQSLPIEERKAKLDELLKKPLGLIRYSVSFTKDVQELLSRARELGLEGLIGKRSGSRYEPGKPTGAWIKLKLHREQEFVIGGYTEPEGSRKYFSALLVGFYEGKKLKFVGADRKGAILRHRPWASPRSGRHRLLPTRRKREPDRDHRLPRRHQGDLGRYQNLEWFPHLE